MNGLKPTSHHSRAATCVCFESAAEHGNRSTCSAARMDTNLSIKQPWHTKYCHLEFEYSDLSANYPTHYMLTLTKIYAVKTGQPRFIYCSKVINYVCSFRLNFQQFVNFNRYFLLTTFFKINQTLFTSQTL